MGDFNFKEVHWEDMTTEGNEDSWRYTLLESINYGIYNDTMDSRKHQISPHDILIDVTTVLHETIAIHSPHQFASTPRPAHCSQRLPALRGTILTGILLGVSPGRLHPFLFAHFGEGMILGSLHT
ncbi:hypothetical protein E2C01_062396 [Portunus trituberculatus]|uniref:Endonuclease/exonuclease/phosphatase domain-containing protein n=1 Tax=Portunus trituberculatus TaxID=210409 RepID=A0A5B7HEJ9_PORTR|nr:hypothetical protein [Portunus trituberculatus]